MRSATRNKTGKSPLYLKFIRAQLCAVLTTSPNFVGCCDQTRTEAAHVGVRGLLQKCPDREAIPLCRFHHRIGPHAAHRLGKKFWTLHGLDPKELIRQFNEQFDAGERA